MTNQDVCAKSVARRHVALFSAARFSVAHRTKARNKSKKRTFFFSAAFMRELYAFFLHTATKKTREIVLFHSMHACMYSLKEARFFFFFGVLVFFSFLLDARMSICVRIPQICEGLAKTKNKKLMAGFRRVFLVPVCFVTTGKPLETLKKSDHTHTHTYIYVYICISIFYFYFASLIST
jgi:hypothetical protein